MRLLYALGLVLFFVAGCSKKTGPASYVGGWNVESINYTWQVYTIEGQSTEQQLRHTAEQLADEHLKKFITVDVIMLWDGEKANEAITERTKGAISASGSLDLGRFMTKGGAFFHKARTGVEDPIANRQGGYKHSFGKLDDWVFVPKH